MKITVCILECFCRHVICLNINDFAIGKNLGPFNTSVSRKTIFFDDCSFMNLKVARNELAKSMKLLISVSGMVRA